MHIYKILALITVFMSTSFVSPVFDEKSCKGEIERIQIEEVRDCDLSQPLTAFHRTFGDGETVDRPLLFKGAALNWPVRNAISDENLIENFGNRSVGIQINWRKDSHTAVSSTLLEHIENIRRDPKQCGYLHAGCSRYSQLNIPSYSHRSPTNPCGPIEGTEENCMCSVLAKDAQFPDSGSMGEFAWFFGGHSITPFHKHQAVFLAQLRGKKKAYLMQPTASSHFDGQETRYSVSEVDPEYPDFDAFPAFRGARVFEAELSEGDVLFIPDDWFHYIKGVEAPSMSLVYHPLPNHERARGLTDGCSPLATLPQQGSLLAILPPRDRCTHRGEASPNSHKYPFP